METNNEKSERPTGMLAFTIVWAGQLVSVLASSMTQFGLTIWAYQETGSAVTLGAIQTAFIIPFMLLTPFAGVWVDRYNRKLMMMVSDLTAVLATCGILALSLTGRLEIWHLYVAAAVNGLGNTFQWPAYSAAISTMLPKEKYGRAYGMMSLIESGPGVLAPILAGLLLPVIRLTGILTIDVVTFLLAIGGLLIVHIPQPKRTVEGQAGSGGLLKEAAYGFKYIFARKGLLSLLIFFIFLNFAIGLAFPVVAPLILTRSGNDSAVFGAVESAFAVGAVLGGLIVGLWGGFKRQMKNIFIGEALTGLILVSLFGLGRSLPLWIPVAVIGNIFPIFTNGASQAIWQAKVAPDVQGRVFSARRLIAWVPSLVTPLLSAALADYVMEPAMRPAGPLAELFGWLVGTEPGAGMAVQFFLAGIAYMLIVLVGFLFFPSLRNLEDDLPDHDKMEKVETSP
ncbi:MAG: MFS transporter [Anaerolineales bacterium]|nr:MFS transporter [Anaerolineales bacterium]